MQCISTVQHSTCIAEVTENSLVLQVTGQAWDMGTVTHIPGKRGKYDVQFVYNTETSVFLKNFYTKPKPTEVGSLGAGNEVYEAVLQPTGRISLGYFIYF